MRATLLGVGALSLVILSCDEADRDHPAMTAGAKAAPVDERRFAIGRPADAATLRAIDRDIGEEGVELPPGRGTVAEGRALYATSCAMCHGVNGEGIAPAFPALSGRDPKGEDFAFANDPKLVHTIGNYWPYATTLFDYIRRAMPLTAPGSLTDDQVYALSAYLLAVDDIIPDTATLDADRLRQVRMPYRDRFVPDDRRPSKENIR